MSDPAPPVAAQKSEDADTPEVVWIPSLLFLRTPCGSINLIGPLPELFGHVLHIDPSQRDRFGRRILIQTPKPLQASVAHLCRCLELKGVHDSSGHSQPN
jgi:hypothetical protein